MKLPDKHPRRMHPEQHKPTTYIAALLACRSIQVIGTVTDKATASYSRCCCRTRQRPVTKKDCNESEASIDRRYL